MGFALPKTTSQKMLHFGFARRRHYRSSEKCRSGLSPVTPDVSEMPSVAAGIEFVSCSHATLFSGDASDPADQSHRPRWRRIAMLRNPAAASGTEEVSIAVSISPAFADDGGINKTPASYSHNFCWVFAPVLRHRAISKSCRSSRPRNKPPRNSNI